MGAKIHAIGNAVRDCELSETSSGVQVCRFTLAVNRGYGENRVTDFFNVTAWKKLAENVAKYVRKGSKVCVYGEPQIRKYTDNNGVERQAFDIQAFDVEFLSTKQEMEGGEQGSQKQHSAPQSYISGGKGNGDNRPPRKPVQMEAFDPEDIPF